MACATSKTSDQSEHTLNFHSRINVGLKLFSKEVRVMLMYLWQQPQGGTLIFSHIRRLELFFGVQNSGFQYFWGFQ